MSANGTMPQQEEPEKTITRTTNPVLPDVSKQQLQVRYKRYQEQIAFIRELLLKISISVERLESENNSLREYNDYLQSGNTKSKPCNRSKINAPSAARAAVGLTLARVETLQMKMAGFEKEAISQITSTMEASQENHLIKAKLEEVQKNFQQEKKKNEHFQEKLNFMENELVKEATLRIAAERRYHTLEKEARELSDELWAQSSQVTGKNQQQLSSDVDAGHSLDSNVVTSTPHASPTRTDSTIQSFSKTTFTRTAPKFTNGFQYVLSEMGNHVEKFETKLKSFFRSRTYFQKINDDIVEHLKIIFKYHPSKNSLQSR